MPASKYKQVDFVDLSSEVDKRIYNGGARIGAGRPKKTVQTKAIRVPIDLLPKITALVDRYKDGDVINDSDFVDDDNFSSTDCVKVTKRVKNILLSNTEDGENYEDCLERLMLNCLINRERDIFLSKIKSLEAELCRLQSNQM